MDAEFVLGTIEEWLDGECPNEHLIGVLESNGVDVDANCENGRIYKFHLSIRDHVFGCCHNRSTRDSCSAVRKLKSDTECIVRKDRYETRA